MKITRIDRRGGAREVVDLTDDILGLLHDYYPGYKSIEEIIADLKDGATLATSSCIYKKV